MLRYSVTPNRVDADNGPIAGRKHVLAIKLDERCYTRPGQTNQCSTRLLLFLNVYMATAVAVVWAKLVRGCGIVVIVACVNVGSSVGV